MHLCTCTDHVYCSMYRLGGISLYSRRYYQMIQNRLGGISLSSRRYYQMIQHDLPVPTVAAVVFIMTKIYMYNTQLKASSSRVFGLTKKKVLRARLLIELYGLCALCTLLMLVQSVLLVHILYHILGTL